MSRAALEQLAARAAAVVRGALGAFGAMIAFVAYGAFAPLAGCGASPAKESAPAASTPEPLSLTSPSPPEAPPSIAGFSEDEVEAFLKLSPLADPPPDPTNRVADDPRAVQLGQFVFFDPRFSRSGEVSCATCHDPSKGWSDGQSLGKGEGELTRHAPSLWNVAYNRWFFWDGRADSLWAQALQPLEGPREHGFTRLQVAHFLHEDPDLRRAYEALFGPLPPLDERERFPPEGRPVPDDPEHPHAVAWAAMSAADQEAVDTVFVNLGKAIAAFERRIVSRRSPFDEFVAGVRANDLLAQRSLGAAARRGLALFLGKARCVLCHSGPNFTDREFHDTRVPPLRGGRRLDAGRYEGVALVQADPFNGAGRFSDAPLGAAEDKVSFLLRSGHNWSEFKTPSLRNVAVTAPYMHQGQLETLDDVLHYYNTLEDAVSAHHDAERILVPLNLSEDEISDLHEFLTALTDVGLDPALTSRPSTPYLP